SLVIENFSYDGGKWNTRHFLVYLSRCLPIVLIIDPISRHARQANWSRYSFRWNAVAATFAKQGGVRTTAHSCCIPRLAARHWKRSLPHTTITIMRLLRS